MGTCVRDEIMAFFTGFFIGFRNVPSGAVWTVALLCARHLCSTTVSNICVVEEASGLLVWFSTTWQMCRAIKEKATGVVPLEDAMRLLFL